MACYAYKWYWGTLLYGYRHNRLEKIREMGRNGALYATQSPLSLDSFGIEDCFWNREIIVTSDCSWNIWWVQWKIEGRRIYSPWLDAQISCWVCMYNGWSHRWSSISRTGAARGIWNQDDSCMASRQGDEYWKERLLVLCRETQWSIEYAHPQLQRSCGRSSATS